MEDIIYDHYIKIDWAATNMAIACIPVICSYSPSNCCVLGFSIDFYLGKLVG